LLDQNVPANFIPMLLDIGHEVITLKQLGQTHAKNGDVGKIGIDQDAIIITFDKHFLSLKQELQQQSRIIYISMYPRDPIREAGLFREKLSICLGKLKKPGVVTLTPDGIDFKRG